MKGFSKQVCVKVTTDTQYHSIKPILQKFAEIGISFDIYVPRRTDNPENVNAMFDRTHSIVEKDGFNNIIREISPNKEYHLALITPNYEEGIAAKYYVKYSYGPSHSLKPLLTHQAYRLNRYHGYILHSLRDAEIFSAFAKTHLLPDLKYLGYERKISRNKKKTVLFLPSWEGQADLSWLIKSARELKKRYSIIVKLHPYGDYGSKVPESVKDMKLEIEKFVDEFYEGEGSLRELMARSDLVVSDISGAVFDALYADVPVVVYSDNIYKFDITGIKSAAAKYVDEGYIYLSKTATELVEAVPDAFTDQYLQDQNRLSKRIFCRDFTRGAVDSWMKIINLYLNDEVDQEYIAMHNLLSAEFWRHKNEADQLKDTLRGMDSEIGHLRSELSSFFGIKRSIRLLAGNTKRRIKGIFSER